MDIRITFLIMFIGKSLAESDKVPQVYEESEDLAYQESARVVRDPTQSQLKSMRIYKPPVFNYRNAYQQDKQKFRYVEQQRADIRNILMKRLPTTRNPTKDQKFRDLHEDIINKREPIESIWTKIVRHPLTRRNVRTSRKLTPNSYYEELTRNGASDIVRRQDHNNRIVYVDPLALKAQFRINPHNEQELLALNALIGQNPNTQLEGLKKLLGEDPQLQQIGGNKDHTPITEQTVDIPNDQDRPNIKTDHSELSHQGGDQNLQDLQSQLDEATKIHTAQALHQAQLEAEALVKAQNEAIAKVQTEAQHEALAKIAAHNQQFEISQHHNDAKLIPENRPHYQNYQQILALPLKAEPDYYIPTPQAGALIHTIQTQNRHNNQELFKVHQAEEHAKNARLQAQKDAQRINTNNKLKKISITNSHSITQAHHRHHPQVFGQLVENHQDFDQEIHHLDEEQNSDEHQYAARYAFGYRIKDVKMGNDFGHEEKRDGHSAKGHYHVLLPDGRLQKVEYYADPTGYHAKVTYENIAHH